MSGPLPTAVFEWVKDSIRIEKTKTNHLGNNPKGYLLEVDLEFPAELHNANNAYSFAPERMLIPEKWMCRSISTTS